MDARGIATQILTQVIGQQHSLSDCLETHLSHLQDSRERALAQELCYGVLRWLPRLQPILHCLLQKPLKTKDNDIYALLLVGLYQHLYLRIPPHAATAATVNVARQLDKAWATGLVNAVLRNLQRQRDVLLKQVTTNPEANWAHPAWLLNKLQTDWQEQWESIVVANNTQAPMSLRVNAKLGSREAYLEELQQAEISAISTPHTENGITLDHALDVNYIPGFAQGRVTVQDGAAQLAAPLLDVPMGATVLDACAAPGGKTTHLLERYQISKLLALDKIPSRVQKLQATLQRVTLVSDRFPSTGLGNVKIRCADASEPATWWDGQPFERILLDVPCSGSGVIRRHPDIKYLRQPHDIETLVTQQAQLLEALWSVLAKQGQLLYVTCSVFACENYLQIQRFIETHANACEIPLPVTWGQSLPIGRQILPGENNFDGFYYACLAKTD